MHSIGLFHWEATMAPQNSCAQLVKLETKIEPIILMAIGHLAHTGPLSSTIKNQITIASKKVIEIVSRHLNEEPSHLQKSGVQSKELAPKY